MGRILKKLNRIRIQINSDYNTPFPKLRFFWLSEYIYERRYIKIKPDGRIVGGLARFISSLMDFSFIRSIGKYPDMKAFVDVLRDPIKGKHYRIYSGIGKTFIPCEATFTNFKDRLGETLYNSIFHVLVRIADQLGFLSFNIIATDGTLFPTNAKYDELNNYDFSRLHGAIPLIDYNPRNENLSHPALKQRGFDRNGWPYAPCGLLTRPI